MTTLAGFDIGGTKCAVVLGELVPSGVTLVRKVKFPTPHSPDETILQLRETLTTMLREEAVGDLAAIGISCGGPLDSRRGRVLSPPNLPGWNDIDICTPFADVFGVPVTLQNDANACALAEWRWGAGRGTENMVFLTFGTGMGAGLILNGRLYSGTNDMAGEVGHVRLADDGPLGYGKYGSFEGFCSGGGIRRAALAMTARWLAEGHCPSYCPSMEELDSITAESVGAAAASSDPFALQVYENVGRHLGLGLAVLVDVLNPERIVIGSIYARQRALLEPIAMAVLKEEALGPANAVCQVVPAELGENIGDYASLSVAMNGLV